MDLFGGIGETTEETSTVVLAEAVPADHKDLLIWEKEFLGVYLSSHPLMEVLGNGVPSGHAQVVDIVDRNAGDRIRLIGMVTGVRRIATKSNRTMAVLEVEDLTGSVEVVAFPDSFDEFGKILANDALLVFQAKIDDRGENRQLILENASDELPVARPIPPPEPQVALRLPSSGNVWDDIGLMQDIDGVLRRYEGDSEVVLVLPCGSSLVRFRSRSRRVEWCPDLAEELRKILGDAGVEIEIEGKAEGSPDAPAPAVMGKASLERAA
jgi:DNA polymerase-3 subunit alpha